MPQHLTIGLFGFGSVGSGIYHLLKKKTIPNIELKTIVVKNPDKPRSKDAKHFSYQPKDILEDKDINVVLELIDDADAAYSIVKKALEKRKHVITANKKMLAEHFQELTALAQKQNVSLLYEASVCGSIPVIRTLEESFGQDSIKSLRAISNGTCNYVLTRLFQNPQPFDRIITDAQKHGFAESDPTLDIDSWDSKFKLIISNYHAFGVLNTPEDILNLGIRHIKPEDIEFAKEKNFSIKVLGHSELNDDGLNAFVAPQFIKNNNLLTSIEFENNAVQIDAEFAQQQLLQGKGAGSIPTASAVLSDVISLLKDYTYSYSKAEANSSKFNPDQLIKVYISSYDKKDLTPFKFKNEIVCGTRKQLEYKIGKLSIKDLKHQFEAQSAKVFVAVFPD
ncbi:homoserine dehydrogenase [Psychroflexus lacisalsi]|jgi:homoserine dehydrogenase|uniref:Homoserine dehydrogenase n=1 Tax=Psychroflexus lacisalsi TaxID=503928 RepID=A0ABN1K2T4_9FLAO|nr:homoserine dehydrogenase [Psychroflexus lacisalsi]MBZ9618662.1 homoserine dehydrogenase [Psychroflexus lacisalsi]